MKPVFIVAVLSMWGLVGLNMTAAQNVEAVQPPTIELVGTNCVELGSIPCYEYQLIKFVFRNPGNAPVEIQRVLSTCPCIRGYPQTAFIPPKGEATITLELNATVVNGSFVRKVWVETNDKKQPRIGLSVKGEVNPLFKGLPASPFLFRTQNVNETVTNHFVITATETNLVLGASPVFFSNAVMTATACFVATDSEDKTKASYAVTLVMTSHASGRRFGTLDFPVLGRPKLPPLRFTIQGRIGTELNLSPTEALVVPPGEGNSLVRQFRIHINDADVDPAALTWAPQREGVSISVKAAKSKAANAKKGKGSPTGLIVKAPAKALLGNNSSSSLFVTMTINSKAAAQILSEKDPSLTFSYPKYKPTVLRFVSSLSEEKEAEEKEAEEKDDEN